MSAWGNAAAIVERLLADCEAIIDGHPVELDEVPPLPRLDEQPEAAEIDRVKAVLARIDEMKQRVEGAQHAITAELDRGQRLRTAAKAYRSHDAPSTP